MPEPLIFDVHQHIGELMIGSALNRTWNLEEDYAARVGVMDRLGVRAAAALPSLQYERPNGQQDTMSINDLVAGYRERYRDRFPVAIGTVEPLHGIDNGLKEINRIAMELKLDGLVWHHRFQGSFIADPRMTPFLEELQRFGLPAFIHIMAESTMESPWGLERLAVKFPKITFVGLDAFSGLTQTYFLQGIAERCPNIIFETGMAYSMGRYPEQFAKQYGSERVMFGSDLYTFAASYDRPAVLNEVLNSTTLDEADKRNVLWGNAERLFPALKKLA